jgi:hypothetical protein
MKKENLVFTVGTKFPKAEDVVINTSEKFNEIKYNTWDGKAPMNRLF